MNILSAYSLRINGKCQRRSNFPPRGGSKVGYYCAGLSPPGGLKPERGSQAGRGDFLRGVSAGLSGAAMSETIAVAVHLEDVDKVGDAIEQSAGETSSLPEPLTLVSSLTGMPSRCISRSPGRPPVLCPSRPTISPTLLVRRAYRSATGGRRSVNVRRAHSPGAHRQRLSRSFTVTGLPWTGRSCRLRQDQPCRLRVRHPQSGQIPILDPTAETTQPSSTVSATPSTLTPGPGDHFNFVRMPAHSQNLANGE